MAEILIQENYKDDKGVGPSSPSNHNGISGGYDAMTKNIVPHNTHNHKCKTCTSCGMSLQINSDNFYKHKTSKDGFTWCCKPCLLKKMGVYTAANKQAKNDYQKEYAREMLSNPETAKIFKGRKAIAQKKYRANNKEKIRASSKEYAQKNIEAVRKKKRDHVRKRYKTDPGFRLNRAVSESLRRGIKSSKAGRHWETLLDYSLSDLKLHIENLFTDGMSWENHGNGVGKWNIDHKIPVAVFNFSDPAHPDFNRCWALSNLQPMWANDNARKKDKIDQPFQPMFAFTRKGCKEAI